MAPPSQAAIEVPPEMVASANVAATVSAAIAMASVTQTAGSQPVIARQMLGVPLPGGHAGLRQRVRVMGYVNPRKVAVER
ncbi:hypothetical protein Airi02_061660 [Actinoallomurus iriomotensis]|uniref:Uncharacterized protein n=1 Tax=Actinoallomurus iriomotensis TaxID=478107 RepID=A0A9W6W2U7_9ACTN|nr:hypothetical protein Airi02_061660 [Actinoallomurus iriomotensis]